MSEQQNVIKGSNVLPESSYASRYKEINQETKDILPDPISLSISTTTTTTNPAPEQQPNINESAPESRLPEFISSMLNKGNSEETTKEKAQEPAPAPAPEKLPPSMPSAPAPRTENPPLPPSMPSVPEKLPPSMPSAPAPRTENFPSPPPIAPPRMLSSVPERGTGAATKGGALSSSPGRLETPSQPSKNKRGRPSKGDIRAKKPRAIHPHSVRPEMYLLYSLTKTLYPLEKAIDSYWGYFANYYTGNSSDGKSLSFDWVQKIYNNVSQIEKEAIRRIDKCEEQLREAIMSPCEIVFVQMYLCRVTVIKAKCEIHKEDIRQLFNSIKAEEKRSMFQAVVEECDIPFSAMKNSRCTFYVHLVKSSNVNEVKSVTLAGTKDECLYDPSTGLVAVDFPFTESTRGSAGEVKIPLKVAYTVHKAESLKGVEDSVTHIFTEDVLAVPQSRVTVRTNDNQIGKHEHRAIVARVLGSSANPQQSDVRVPWERVVNIAQLYIALKAPRMQHMKPSKGSSSALPNSPSLLASQTSVDDANDRGVSASAPSMMIFGSDEADDRANSLAGMLEGIADADAPTSRPPAKKQKLEKGGDGDANDIDIEASAPNALSALSALSSLSAPSVSSAAEHNPLPLATAELTSTAAAAATTQAPQTPVKKQKLVKERILPGDADAFIEKYKHYKRDYLSIADYETLWQTLFEDKYSKEAAAAAVAAAVAAGGNSGTSVERKRMLGKEDVELFIEVIMAFVATLKTQMIAYLWNAGYVVGFVSRIEAANIALRLRKSIIRLSCKVEAKGDRGDKGDKPEGGEKAGGETSCEVKWVITNKNDTHIQLNNLVGASVEKVAELIKGNSNIDDFGYVENSERNFLEKSTIRKFFVSEREIAPEAKDVKKNELFDGIMKKKDDVTPSVPKVPGYIDLMIRTAETSENSC